MAMELKNWQKLGQQRVQMMEALGVSQICFDFIHAPSLPEREEIAKKVSKLIQDSIRKIFEALAEKEGKRIDAKTIQHFTSTWGKEAIILTFRIMDDLLIKEYTNKQNNGPRDFTFLISRDIFVKSILVSALETVFFINIVKGLVIYEILGLVDLKPFDYWRLLNIFLKFDPQMPLNLVSHFREIELKIVNECAWTADSPVI